jgi:hypothetical protein
MQLQRIDLIRSKFLSSNALRGTIVKWLNSPSSVRLECKTFLKRIAVEATLYIRYSTPLAGKRRTRWTEQ